MAQRASGTHHGWVMKSLDRDDCGAHLLQLKEILTDGTTKMSSGRFVSLPVAANLHYFTDLVIACMCKKEVCVCVCVNV